ncbi:MAG: YceI family protein [Flaviaesturariibacter sp.]|nr:YceI family protein [Flaviaesturariibacter sp.]
MKKLAFLFTAFAALSAFALAGSWKSDKAHSRLGFSVTHLGISDISGEFRNFDVTVSSSKADFSDAKFELTADVASINTSVDMRDKHLQSPDFFDAAKFPTLTFKSTALKPAGKNKYKVTGNLTLHGVTRPVTMDLVYRGTISNPMSKAPTAGFQVTGTIKRSEFGIGAGFPAPMLSDDVRIKADGEFGKQ